MWTLRSGCNRAWMQLYALGGLLVAALLCESPSQWLPPCHWRNVCASTKLSWSCTGGKLLDVTDPQRFNGKERMETAGEGTVCEGFILLHPAASQ